MKSGFLLDMSHFILLIYRTDCHTEQYDWVLYHRSQCEYPASSTTDSDLF